MKVDIYANNTRVPLTEGLTMRFFNPLFNDTGDYSFPLIFSACQSCIKAFGYPGEKGNSHGVHVDGRIRIDKMDLMGRWKVERATSKSIEAVFMSGNGDFNSLIRGKGLKDLDMGGLIYPAGAYAGQEELCSMANLLIDVSYPESDYTVYCAYMPNAYGSNTTEGQKFLNKVTLQQWENVVFSHVNSLYLFAGKVIDSIFEENGYRVVYNIFREDDDLKRVTIFNTCQQPFYEGGIYLTQLLPNISCADFLKAVRNRFNIIFEIDETSKSVKIQSFNEIIEQDPVAIRFMPGKKITDKNRIEGVLLGLRAPDDWASHDIKGEDEFYPFSWEVKDKLRDIIATSTYLNHVYTIKSECAIYRVVYTGGEYEARRVCPNLMEWREGINETEQDQLSGVPGMYTYSEEFNYTYWVEDEELPESTTVDFVVPRCDLVGINDDYNQEDFPLMFVMAWGKQKNYVLPADHSFQTYYPMGSVDVYDATGAAIPGAGLSLRWDSVYGLVERFWKHRIRWEMENIERVTLEELPGDELDKLIDFSRPVMIGHDKYLVNSFTLESTAKQVRLREVELLRL